MILIRQLDLDAIGARGRARGLGDEAHLAARALAGDETHLGTIAELDAGELALRHLDDGQHRIERHQRRDLLAGERERGLADLDPDIVNDARPGRAHLPALELGFGRGECRFRCFELGFEIDAFEPRDGAAAKQPPLGIELGLALGDERFHGGSTRKWQESWRNNTSGDSVYNLVSPPGRPWWREPFWRTRASDAPPCFR